MMHEPEKSGLAVVAMKPTNKAERSAAELGEPRAGAEGNAGLHSTDRARNRATVSQGLERIRQVSPLNTQGGSRCGKAACTVLCGGRSEMSVPTAIVVEPVIRLTEGETRWLLAMTVLKVLVSWSNT